MSPSLPPLNLLPPYPAKVLRGQGKQRIIDAEGRQYPSVSHILQRTKPRADRLALQAWRQRVGVHEAQRIATQASGRGVSLHTVLKNYLSHQPWSVSAKAEPYWQSIQAFLSRIESVRLVEGFVCHQTCGYAGRVDCVIECEGEPVLIDWKSAGKPKHPDYLRDTPLQLVAYWGALEHCYPELALSRCAIVVALPHQEAQIFWFSRSQYADLWQQWRQRLDEFWRLSRFNPNN
ncbi:MAG: PD-(D/E)XK nuclease family protein [Cyanobacteria bacterium P01_H01_bin.15]